MVRRAVTTPFTYARARDLPHRLHRHRPATIRRSPRGARRCCATPRSPWPMPSATAATGSRSSAPTMRSDRSDRFHDGNRPSPGARPRRDEGAVQADRAPGGPHHRRLRVDAALGSSPARPHRPRGLHADCRGNRPHRQAERVPAGADRPRARCLAERARGRAADLRQRQHVEPSPAAPRPAAGREDGASPAPASCPAPSRSR